MKKPICVRGTWDADIVAEVAPIPGDHVVIKRRDSISSNKKHYESTIDNITDYYGLVMELSEFSQYLPQSQTTTLNKSK